MSGISSFSLQPRPSARDRTLSVEAAPLFPTRLWQARLAPLAAQVPAWVAAVEAARAASPEPAGRSNRQGWNSADKTVLDRPVFADLKAAIGAGVSYALGQMAAARPAYELESWINLHDRGGFNFLHIHDGCLLSGVFYLQVPEGSGRLVFRDPRPGVLNSPFKGPNANGHNDVHLTPETGLLVMFPNWLEHYVEPHGSDTPRIAISFNALQR